MKFLFHPEAEAELRDESILVLAVMHLRRHPDYWRERK